MPRSQLLLARRLVVLVPALTVATTLGGCGGTLPEAGSPGQPPAAGGPPAVSAEPGPDTSGFAETGGSGHATTSAVPEPAAGTELRPPRVVLESGAGRQEAVQGSFCVTKVNESGQGQGVCGDSPFQHPKELNVVQPHEEVMIDLTDAAAVDRPEGCSPACPSTVTVHPLGCGPDRAVTDFELVSAKTAWTVDLEPGAYELAVFAYFETQDGRTGDTSGVLGLLVDSERQPAVIPIDKAWAVCPFPDQP
jgi:hypothetical protein